MILVGARISEQIPKIGAPSSPAETCYGTPAIMAHTIALVWMCLWIGLALLTRSGWLSLSFDFVQPNWTTTVGLSFSILGAQEEACETHMVAKSDILRHVGTTPVARDMLEIVHKLGYEKLKYWGFSYGTVLGGVFASMYPDKIERLVSDGNVDIREWHYQTYINFLRDTDKVLDAFYDFCHEAGPGACALYADTPELIRRRMENLLEKIRRRPVLVTPDGSFATTDNMPQLITWSHIRRSTATVLYQPLLRFKTYATVLAALESGDGRPFYSLYSILYPDEESSVCSIETISPDIPRLEGGNGDAFPAIQCSDQPQANQTVEEFIDFAKQLTEISKSSGDINTLYRLNCIGRTIRPKWRFDGPFEGNTSFPILYINNIADNVAPLGQLPKPGTTCEPNFYPFQDSSTEREHGLSVSLSELSKTNWDFMSRWSI
ncbi:hypothetical protein EKO27_g10828 [Xylaria grammica]|uniref:AB hydrolase-1 domain-containing protein n=1 Tax=Xylaria grammica TaxID=363999 RepID=A0A439CQ31_9PEZI|nr:hypothetical protein EKO27_g10828 [Xylaria grammica]